jgi:hypothetical protein
VYRFSFACGGLKRLRSKKTQFLLTRAGFSLITDTPECLEVAVAVEHFLGYYFFSRLASHLSRGVKESSKLSPAAPAAVMRASSPQKNV